jgi:CRP-like cAMP-binding protein
MSDTMASITEEEKLKQVEKQACFKQLTSKEKEVLASLFKLKTFNTDQTIVKEGEIVDSVYLILNGEASVRTLRFINGEPQVNLITTLGKGAAIGLNETGFYSLTGRRTATVVAINDVTTLCLSVAAFHGFALEYSHVNEVMHRQAEDYTKD